ARSSFSEARPPIATPNVAFSFSSPLGVPQGSPPARRLRPLPSSSARPTASPGPLPGPDVRLRDPRLPHLASLPPRPLLGVPLLVEPPRALQSGGYGLR